MDKRELLDAAILAKLADVVEGFSWLKSNDGKQVRQLWLGEDVFQIVVAAMRFASSSITGDQIPTLSKVPEDAELEAAYRRLCVRLSRPT